MFNCILMNPLNVKCILFDVYILHLERTKYAKMDVIAFSICNFPIWFLIQHSYFLLSQSFLFGLNLHCIWIIYLLQLFWLSIEFPTFSLLLETIDIFVLLYWYLKYLISEISENCTYSRNNSTLVHFT